MDANLNLDNRIISDAEFQHVRVLHHNNMRYVGGNSLMALQAPQTVPQIRSNFNGERSRTRSSPPTNVPTAPLFLQNHTGRGVGNPDPDEPDNFPDGSPISDDPDRVEEPELNDFLLLNRDMKLVDLHPEDFGHLSGISNSVSFIPSKYLRRLRLVWIKYMQKAMDTDHVLDWKKYFLLPIILFDNSIERTSRDIKTTLSRNLDLLQNDDWESFTVSSLSRKSVSNLEIHTDDESHLNRLHKLAHRYATKGELSKALKVLLRPDAALPDPAVTFDQLRAKFPRTSEENCLAMEVLQRFQLSDDVQRLEVSEERVASFVRGTRNLVKHGFDKMRHEHLKALMGPFNDVEPDAAEFRRVYTKLINKLISGDIPTAVIPMFRDIDLIAVPKSGNDIRPIGVNNLDRKIAGFAVNAAAKEFSVNHFHGLQYCMEKNGCEKIIHTFRASMELRPEFDCFFMDGENAFNNLIRATALKEIRDHFPAILPYALSIYGSSSKAWFSNEANPVLQISSEEGVHQGDVNAMFIHAMGTLPFVKRLRDSLGNDGFVKFFADDGNITAPFDKMVDCIRVVLEEGPKVGYFLKFTKGTYLLGKCGSLEEAIRRKTALIRLGLHPSIIKIHPSDADPDVSADAKLDYGASILGSWVGSKAFIRAQLDSQIQDLEVVKSAIQKYPDAQVRFLMLRYCFAAKINYLQRTVPPYLLESLVTSFSRMKKELLCSILGTGLTADTIADCLWSQCCLNVSDGGLGLRDTESVTPCAFVASVVECLPTVSEMLPNYVELFSADHAPSLTVRQFRKSLRHIGRLANNVGSLASLQDVQQLHATAHDDDTLQGLLQMHILARQLVVFRESLRDDSHRLAWYTSICDGNAGRWLEVSPKSEHFSFSNAEFQALLCYRLYLSQPSFIPGSRCNCKSRPQLDALGHHIATGCGKGGFRNATHTAIQYAVKDLLSCSGIMARREETGCFRGSNEDNNQRPDLSVWGMPESQHKVVADISVTAPVPVRFTRKLSLAQATKPGRAASVVHNAKVAKYAAVSAANSLEFQPLIFESTGRQHPSCEAFLKRALQKMSNGNQILMSVYCSYWMSRITCVLQKHIACAILHRSDMINGRLVNETNYEYSDGFIFENARLI